MAPKGRSTTSRRMSSLAFPLAWLMAGWCLTAEAAAAGKDADAMPKELPIIVLAGQSNMVGLADLSELSEDEAAAQEDVYCYSTDAQWGKYTPSYNYPEMGMGLGPEVSVGKAIAKVKGKVGMVKYAVGGTNLYFGWNPGLPGSLYYNMTDRVNAALKDLQTQLGVKGRVAGFFWMQGESDAVDTTQATAYMVNLMILMAKVRQDFNDPDLPFVIGRISASPLWPYGVTVRIAQTAVGTMIPGASVVATEDLPLRADLAHYDTRGIVTLGSRFAEAFLGAGETQPTGLAALAAALKAQAAAPAEEGWVFPGTAAK